MKKFLLAAVAAATLTGAAGAASAQAYGPPHHPGYDGGYRDGGYRDDDRRGGGYGSAILDAKRSRVAMHIARGERSGALGRREARNLRIELAQVADLEQRFRMSRGLDRREIAILSNRLDRLDGVVIAQLREGRGGYGYGYGYGGQDGNGYGDRDGRDDRGRGY